MLYRFNFLKTIKGIQSEVKKNIFASHILQNRVEVKHSFAHSLRACCLTSNKQIKEQKMSEFYFPNDQPVALLNCESAFNALTSKEKLYAHYLSRAAWYGGLIDLVQTSLESPLIFCLLHKLFEAQPIEELKEIALQKCNLTEDEFTALLVYTSGIFSSMGNYKSFGDKKFVPNLPKEKFQSLVRASAAAQKESSFMDSLLSRCLEPIYSLKDGEKQLGFPNIGITTYLSKNFTKEDEDIVKNFFKKQNIEAYNSRLFKTVDASGNTCYEVRLASILQTDSSEENNLTSTHTLNGHKFVISRGDYAKLLELVNENLMLAKKYAANTNEEMMLEHYIKSFRTGSLDSHKDGSRYWIKDKGPIIESYIGFIETYRDPAGMRGEFEGFVAMVNKPMSAKFSELVESATRLLPQLPWPPAYEKDEFLRPDFTSLDVLTFAGSGVPAGICIPNYNEIRQSEGFKNVSLGNVISVSSKKTPNYLSKEDQVLFEKYRIPSFEVHVGLHELLGHGSGKLFQKEKCGSFNFDVENVLHSETSQKISTWYEVGDTYDSIFGALGSSYEECRADCVGLYLSTVPEVLRIFGHTGEEAETVTYVNWLSACRSGIESLQLYEPATKSWLQAHSQALYVILRVLLEEAGDFVKIERLIGEDGEPDLLLTVDRSKLETVAKPVLGHFLKKLQVYRATADISAAREMFNKYSVVSTEGKHPFLEYREIVMARKKPRIMFVQSNTVLENGEVLLKSYEPTHEDMIQSWIDRFREVDVTSLLEELWEKDRPHFM
ncbi:dipeptidyl peptidase 3-like [Uloborus diversus]|uniref:dipeptidyl peptidase 3-like n=1 Tax=Uloborus diversus TaxID=327109 RepID=UPI0024094257|nr:dipeptidyl peptidase 3-like [Uloborus diversus]